MLKFPTIPADEKAEVGRVREEKGRRKKIRRKKCRCAKRYKSRKTLCSPTVLWLRRVGKWLAKAPGAEPFGQMKMKDWTLLWREAHSEVKSAKNWQIRSTFGS